MSEQTIIKSADQPASTLETVLASVGTDQLLSCEFLDDIEKWSCTTYRSVGHQPTGYGLGTTLAAALADLHPPQFMKRARDAGLQEWATEEEPE
jgi:hypothetical protein